MKLRMVGVLGGVLIVLGACGGTTAGGIDGGACQVRAMDGQRACVIGRAKANAALTLEADATGCLGCGSSMLPCKVTVNGSTITLALEEKVCPLPKDVACPADCGLPKAKCEVPPLAPGSYTVDVAASVRSSSSFPRTLVVESNGSATACALDFAPPKSIAATDFDQSCSVPEDCAPIAEGNPCSPCACPSAAIAKSALADYQATLRERTSQCAPNGGPSCAPCMSVTTTCLMGKCGVMK